jgi:hypothetical protein
MPCTCCPPDRHLPTCYAMVAAAASGCSYHQRRCSEWHTCDMWDLPCASEPWCSQAAPKPGATAQRLRTGAASVMCHWQPCVISWWFLLLNLVDMRAPHCCRPQFAAHAGGRQKLGVRCSRCECMMMLMLVGCVPHPAAVCSHMSCKQAWTPPQAPPC